MQMRTAQMNMRICAQGLIALRDAHDKRFEMHVVLALIFLHILQACEIIEVTEIVHAKVSEQYERCLCCRVPFHIRLCNYISTEWKVVGTYTVQGLPLLQYIAKSTVWTKQATDCNAKTARNLNVAGRSV